MSLFYSNRLHIFLLFCLTSILVTFLYEEVLISDNLYFNSLGEQLSYGRIVELLEGKRKWAWLNYLLFPIIYFLKCVVISIALSTGAFFSDIKISIGRLLQIVMVSELIFFIPNFIKLFWFFFIDTEYHLEDIQYFYPLSMLNFFHIQKLDPWWVYPLQILNVFEVLYIFLLAYGFSKFASESFFRSFSVTFSSYGTWISIWIVFVTFISLSFN
jgi:hypothetical protein